MKTQEQINKLQQKIRDIEIKEAEKANKKRLEDNYKKFLNRPSDWVIGKAHAEPTFKDNGWHHPKGHQMPLSVSINGNGGHTYYPTAWVTSSTNTYFHNVWKNGDEEAFQEKLNKLVQEEVERIMNNPHHVLDLMGLQSITYYLDQYPKDKIEKIKAEIQKEQDKVLDKFTDEELLNVNRLSHSFPIYKSYMERKRPHLKCPERENMKDQW